MGLDAETDTDLVVLARQGSREAFAELVRRHQGPLVNLFLRMGADVHGAEDCVQDTFLRLLRSLKDYEPRAPFGAYLCTLARHAWIDWKRRADRRRMESLDGAGERAAVAERSPEADERLDLRSALAGLPEHLRLVVILSVDQGLNYGEISAVLGIPVGTVKSRMFFAVRHLREALDARSGR